MWTSTASLNNVKRNAIDDGAVIGSYRHLAKELLISSVIITTADIKSPTRSTTPLTASTPNLDASSPTVVYPSTVALETGSQPSLTTSVVPSEDSQGGVSKSTIAGIIGGTFCGLLLVGAGVFLLFSRLRKKSEKVRNREPDPDEYITLSGNLGKDI